MEKYLKALPVPTTVSEQTKAMAHSQGVKEAEGVRKITNVINNQMINPFTYEEQELINLSTGYKATSADLICACEKGLEALAAARRSDSDKVAQIELSTFAAKPKKSMSMAFKAKKIYEEESAVVRNLYFVHDLEEDRKDRCGYTLMKTSSIPDLQVRSTFQERRRTDVSFLDTVILSLDKLGVQIHLEQGGRVKQGNTLMNFNTTTVHGVELSKDQTGVTVKMSHLNYTMSVFFDGYTAQIHIKGPSGQVPFVEGLCGNSSISEARLSANANLAQMFYFRVPWHSGDPVVCNNTARSATLVGCLLEDKGIHYTDLHLYDKTCKAQMDDVTHMVTMGFDTKTNPCGTMLRMNSENQIINKNGLMLESTSEEVMDFTCPFVIPEITIDFSMDIKVKEGASSTSVAYVIFGNWTYTLTMTAFIDSRRTQPVDSNTVLHLNQRVWFEIKADIMDNKQVVLVTQSCYATNEPFAGSNLRYNLIVNGCPNSADQSVVIESNGESASNHFSFKMFQFTGKNPNVYLHCNLSLCLNENNSCIPVLFQKYLHRHKYMQATLHLILLIVVSQYNICIWTSHP
ncbi:Uromodulin [Nibea albiflora]|uniref:Uromodulin n=1 Tax=Nibea albiflora TaxID=240163 RepID=A0ACB7F042_NIBAL|nr:Uromodulin [Nibea albiflora]